MNALQARVRKRLLAIDGVVEGENVFSDGAAFWVNGTQVAHFMDDAVMQLRLTRAAIRAQRERLRADARVELRQGASDWVKIRVTKAQRCRARRASWRRLPRRRTGRHDGATPAPPPTGADLAAPSPVSLAEHMDKTELLAAIARDRARLEELIAGIDDARMTEPSLEGGWSVKDVLAHISAVGAHLHRLAGGGGARRDAGASGGEGRRRRRTRAATRRRRTGRWRTSSPSRARRTRRSWRRCERCPTRSWRATSASAGRRGR